MSDQPKRYCDECTAELPRHLPSCKETDDGATGPIEWTGPDGFKMRMRVYLADADNKGAEVYPRHLVAALQANAALRAEVLSRLQAESDSENYWHIRGEGAERREVELRELLRLAESELAEAKAEIRGLRHRLTILSIDARTVVAEHRQHRLTDGDIEDLDNAQVKAAKELLRSPQQPARPATEAEYRPMFGDLVTGLYGPGVVVELLPGKQCRVQLHTGKAELCDWSDLELRAEPAAEQVAPLTREQADEALGEELERHPIGGHGRQVAPPPIEPDICGREFHANSEAEYYCEKQRGHTGECAWQPAAEQAGAAGGEPKCRGCGVIDFQDVSHGSGKPCCVNCWGQPQADSRMLGPVEAFRQELIAALTIVAEGERLVRTSSPWERLLKLLSSPAAR